MVKMIVEKCFPDAQLPVRQNKGDAGADVIAHNIKMVYRHSGGNGETLFQDQHISKLMDGKELELQYLDRVLIGTGIKATAGEGYEIQVRPRSGLALKQGLTVLNSPGTIDAAYRSEIGVILVNNSRKSQKIKLGDRIAQLVVKPVELCDIVEGKLDDADRGGGFGSTNK